MSIPPAPEEPKDPDEEAWNEYRSHEKEEWYWPIQEDIRNALKEGFLAGRKSAATEGGSHA